jgi:galactokinase
MRSRSRLAASTLSACALLPATEPDVYPMIGALLTEAHRSLRDNFEVSWPHADVTVDAALATGPASHGHPHPHPRRTVPLGGNACLASPEALAALEDAALARAAGKELRRHWTRSR